MKRTTLYTLEVAIIEGPVAKAFAKANPVLSRTIEIRGLQTLEQLQQETVAKVVLKALQGARIVGSVRASVQGGTCQIERLIVHPELQGRGIGTRLMHEVEACFPGPRVTSCSRATAARATCSSTPGWGTAPSASSSSATA